MELISEASKRKAGLVVEDENEDARNKRLKSIHKASSNHLGLGMGMGVVGNHHHHHMRLEHRNMLRRLVQRLVRQQNWEEASGALSMFMKGTYKDRSPETNRFKYSLALGIANHIEDDQMNPMRIKNIYDIWMRNIGTMKNFPIEVRSAVQVDYTLFCLTKGNLDDAYQAALCLMQEHEFEKDGMSNLIVGLTFYELWYSNIPKHLQYRQQVDELCSSPTESDNSVTSMQCDESETSVQNDLHMEAADHSQSQGLYMVISDDESEAASQSSKHNKQYGSVFSVSDRLDPWLFPIQFPDPAENFQEFSNMHRNMINDDRYRKAVKYLQCTLDFPPPVSCSALLPLIQLLLIGDQVDEAMRVLDKFDTDLLSMRIRASLLELYLGRNNHAMLSTSLENILRKDPACHHSLTKLINMHRNGYYSVESLVGMVASHLDVKYEEADTWKELALCFLGVVDRNDEEDRMSSVLCGDGNYQVQYSSRSRMSRNRNRTPTVFTQEKSAKTWRIRCAWWNNRNFTLTAFLSEIEAGHLHLLAYKAACAAHMYGQNSPYVLKAHTYLQTQNSLDLLAFLSPHIQNPIDIQSNIPKPKPNKR